jgi:hypothetical protein
MEAVMLRVLLLLQLLSYSVVASQPLFYLLALGDVSRSLRASAYIELRHGLNAVMQRRVPGVYGAAAALSLIVLVAATSMGAWFLVFTTTVTLGCVVADTLIMVRASVPVNRVMDAWQPERAPEDWQTHRAAWFRVFRYRQVVAILGLASLAAGIAWGA